MTGYGGSRRSVSDSSTAMSGSVSENAQLSPQLYLIFVRERGWSPDTWEEWARTTLRHPGLYAGTSLIKIR